MLLLVDPVLIMASVCDYKEGKTQIATVVHIDMVDSYKIGLKFKLDGKHFQMHVLQLAEGLVQVFK